MRVRLLGPFRMERAGKPVTDFKSNKVRALLAYLAVERQRPHHRDVLAGLLWPTSSSSSALALLRDALSNLRLLLGDRDTDTPRIQVVQDTLQLQFHKADRFDVTAFTKATTFDAAVPVLERAVELYRGDFLDGFSLAGAPDFEAWVLLQREVHRRTLLQALYRLTTHYLQQGSYVTAAVTARRQLRLDPYTEEAHRQLLRALALGGQRNQALAHYMEYRALLDEELGVAPDIRTTALYQRIHDRRLTAGPATSPMDSGGVVRSDISDPLPFVGREAELARLAEGLRRAQRGEGQVLLLSGEAGSGKTLLLQAFMQRHVVGALGAVAAWGACNAQMGDGDPYLPFREILRLLTGDFDVSTLRDCMTPALAQQLEALMPTVTAALQRFGPDLFGSLLPADRELAFAPDARSSRPSPLPAALCDQVERVFGAVARRCTLVLVLEDLHWADSSTLNLLTHLGRRLHQSRILLVGSYRSTEAPPALTRAIHELQRRRGDITLDLDQTAGRAFVDAVVDSSPNALTPTFREQLYRQTDGHALFTVALIEQLRAEGVLTYNAAGEWVAPEDLNWHYLPPQVEAVIAARVDDLSAAHQALLTAASVEGETFTADVMAQVLELTVDSVQQALSGPLHACQLVAAQGLERIGQRRVARYRFRHSLFQQYLYEQLDLVQRAQHHEAVGRALESLYADRPEAAAKLAYHFEAAGLLEEAVTYLTQAGAYAYRLSAPTEAIKLYRRGLKLVGQLPESVARDRQELALQMGLDMPLFAARGWGAPERAVALKRAHALARRLEAMPQLLFILRSLADVNTAQAEHRQSLVYAEQLAKMSQRSGNQAHEIISYRMVGISHFFLGHYQDARAWLEKGIRRAKTLRQKGMDPSALPEAEETAFLWGWLPIIFFVLGYPEQALATSREALARVQEQGHVHAQAKMLTVAGLAFHATIRQPEMALHYADELLVLATDHHLPAFKGWAIFYLGWARAALGQTEEGLSEMAAGWEQLRATGTEASLAYLLTLLTQAYMDAGHYQRSAEILTRALRIAEQTDARAYLAEMYRLRGELCLVHPEQARLEEAEPWFYKALELAQKQTARLWELRATVSLARLWKTQGRASDARARLAELYAGFTEGQDMPDLMEARTLLASL